MIILVHSDLLMIRASKSEPQPQQLGMLLLERNLYISQVSLPTGSMPTCTNCKQDSLLNFPATTTVVVASHHNACTWEHTQLIHQPSAYSGQCALAE